MDKIYKMLSTDIAKVNVINKGAFTQSCSKTLQNPTTSTQACIVMVKYHNIGITSSLSYYQALKCGLILHCYKECIIDRPTLAIRSVVRLEFTAAVQVDY